MHPASLTSSSHLCDIIPQLHILTQLTTRSLQSRTASLRGPRKLLTCSAHSGSGSPTNSSFGHLRANSDAQRSGLQKCRLSILSGQYGRPIRGHSVAAEGGESSRGMSDQPPQEAVLKAISEVSKMEGRDAKTTNVVIGGTESPYGSDWMELDKKVNTYPSLRGFTAIGTGGSDFVQAMVFAVESVLQEPIPQGRVRHRESAQGRYISVKIGPMRVESSLQVREIYQAMRRDERMKYFL
eukprot:TRINITY_DN3527_c0_g1_i1.p1 TRINITY_DN3527_c0_g1~~TRINITY_DN3527_c0_g1_i1.p1  ORF type:complete len:239 (-),score=20.01 TRINITY_DN3527_c0_g1_i1:227-943(-)